MQIEDSPLGGVTYARFFPSDWRSGCITLTLEEEGLYIRSCAWMYDTGQALPGNDKSAAKILNVQVQKYSKVMQSLVDKGKMIRAQGQVFNQRVLDELDKYRKQQSKRSVAARLREAQKALKLQEQATQAILDLRGEGQENNLVTPQATPPPTPLATPQATPPRLVGGYPLATPEGTYGGGSEKVNEINGAGAEDCQTSGRALADAGKSRIQNPESIKRREEEEGPINQSIRTHHYRASAQSPEAVAGQVDEIEPDEGPLHPSVAEAARLLARLFGSEDDPDHDRGLKTAQRWAAIDGPRAVLDAALDFCARRDDRSEFRSLTESLFGRYVRQAAINRERGVATDVAHVEDRPPPKAIEPGPVGDGMSIDADGRIELSNGAKARWLDQFGGNERLLAVSLIEVAGELNPRSPTPVSTQIESRLARISRDITTSDARYRRAAERRERVSYGSTPTDDPDKPVESRGERLARKMREIAQRNANGGQSA